MKRLCLAISSLFLAIIVISLVTHPVWVSTYAEDPNGFISEGSSPAVFYVYDEDKYIGYQTSSRSLDIHQSHIVQKDPSAEISIIERDMILRCMCSANELLGKEENGPIISAQVSSEGYNCFCVEIPIHVFNNHPMFDELKQEKYDTTQNDKCAFRNNYEYILPADEDDQSTFDARINDLGSKCNSKEYTKTAFEKSHDKCYTCDKCLQNHNSHRPFSSLEELSNSNKAFPNSWSTLLHLKRGTKISFAIKPFAIFRDEYSAKLNLGIRASNFVLDIPVNIRFFVDKMANMRPAKSFNNSRLDCLLMGIMIFGIFTFFLLDQKQKLYFYKIYADLKDCCGDFIFKTSGRIPQGIQKEKRGKPKKYKRKPKKHSHFKIDIDLSDNRLDASLGLANNEIENAKNYSSDFGRNSTAENSPRSSWQCGEGLTSLIIDEED